MKVYIGIILLLHISIILAGRSIHRKSYNDLPKITAYWNDFPKQKYILVNSHLERISLFTKFDKDYLYQHKLPETDIKFRNKCEYVSGKNIK